MLNNLLAQLDNDTIVKLARGAKAARKVEQRGFMLVDDAFNELADKATDALVQGLPPPDLNFTPILLQVIYQAMQAGFEIDPRLPPNTTPSNARLASVLKPIKMPRNPRELRIWWDMVRHFRAPKRIQVLANKIKHTYINKVQSVWEKTAEDFRQGKVWNQDVVKQVMKEVVDVGRARARTIVATETTRYFNDARVAYYDQIPAVTHYMFISIRDKRTTPWCLSRQGLIYTKGTELFKLNTPPCFLGGTPIMTLDGWKSIGTVKEGDYVFTAQGNWRRVTRVHCKSQRLENIFQIGYALATSNHPYLCRSGEYIFAEYFRAKEGVCAISFDLPEMRKTILDALEQVQGKVGVRYEMPHCDFSRYSQRSCESELEGWIKSDETWLSWYSGCNASNGGFPGLCKSSSLGNGEASWEIFTSRRGNTPYRPEQKEQLYRESTSDVGFRAHQVTQEIRQNESSSKQIEVYNLEVELDHTYCAGGFFVHNCHWNCRSEIVPLMPFGKENKKLINDPKLRAENNKVTPLPKGWNQ